MMLMAVDNLFVHGHVEQIESLSIDYYRMTRLWGNVDELQKQNAALPNVESFV